MSAVAPQNPKNCVFQDFDNRYRRTQHGDQGEESTHQSDETSDTIEQHPGKFLFKLSSDEQENIQAVYNLSHHYNHNIKRKTGSKTCNFLTAGMQGLTGTSASGSCQVLSVPGETFFLAGLHLQNEETSVVQAKSAAFRPSRPKARFRAR